jgi:protein-disulfide isomerase
VSDSPVVSSEPVEHVLGDVDAPVTVLEYGDYECPYCAGAAPVLRALVEQSGGQLRLVFRNFPLFEVHPHALTAALAAESTVASGSFWAMHALLFQKQNRLSDPDLRLYAEHVGADPALATGYAAQQFAPKVQADYAAGVSDGTRSTPTLFIDGSPYAGRIELPALQRATGMSRAPGLGRRRRPR